mmetsp:Transcript_7154/g.20209  ORF Transcript_7154/g.20209 Transcript_7154/m.20209 type:complete len:249 (+) Transcript_7154:107-853(+)
MASTTQVYTSVDGKTYRSVDGLLTSARVRLHNASNWLRNHEYYRGMLIGAAMGLLVAFMIAGFDKEGLIIRESELEAQLREERDTLRQALQKAVDKVREAENRASRAIEHANQQMHATAQRAMAMQGEVKHHIHRVHQAQEEAGKHQQDSLHHQQLAAQHAASLQETSQHLTAVKQELDKVEVAEASWEKFHRAAIEKTIRHGEHKAFPHMILNAEADSSSGWRVGQKAAVTLDGGPVSKGGRGRKNL